jgi:predicted TIM-barrel fold metal-dependent hydrolase
MITDNLADAPIVDSHAHVYTTDMPLSATAWHKPPADATIEQYVATLDQHGVKYAVLAAPACSMITTNIRSRPRAGTNACAPPPSSSRR